MLQDHDVVIISRNETNLKEALSRLKNPKNKKMEYIAMDLSDAKERQKLHDYNDIMKGTTVLINNLGIYYENSEISDLSKIMETNLISAIEVTNFLEEQLILQSGNVFNIGSVMSIDSKSFALDYSISKHAFKAWNDGLREKLRSKNVSVSAIYPGAINTSSWDGEAVDRSAMIQPEDIASLIGQILTLNKSSLVEEIRLSPFQF